MGRETDAACTCENTIFLQFGISCELGNRKNGTGSTKVALACENTMFCALRNKLQIKE